MGLFTRVLRPTLAGVLLLGIVIALVVVPVVELYVIIQVGGWIGFLPAIALLLSISIVGGYLVKRQGTGTWRRAQAQLRAGELPAAELMDGAVILAAGAMLLTPGFVTDAIGLLLLVSPLRWLPRRWARNHVAVRTGNRVYGRVIDVRNTATGPPPDRTPDGRPDATRVPPAIKPPDSPPRR